MSGTNSIHGIVLVGAIGLAATADNPLAGILAFVAMAFAGANVVGGYWVTDRMLQMFKRRPTPPHRQGREVTRIAMNATNIGYLVHLAFIAGRRSSSMGLHQMNSPATAERATACPPRA
jgi:NAD/NADP transhydrogenase alpha subunit